MAKQTGERTEKATSRRRQRAKDQGQFPYSQELTSAITLTACAVTAFYYLSSPAGFGSFFSSVLENAATMQNPEQALVSAIRRAVAYFLAVAGPVFGAAVLGALAGNFLQGLPNFAPERSIFKWDRLGPNQALSRLKTQISWTQWMKLLCLVAVVGAITWKTLAASWQQLVTLPAYSIDSSNSIIRSFAVRIVGGTGVAVIILALADVFIQRWRFEGSIKQTKAEVKEDIKAAEGNPAMKAKIRSIQRETARRMMERVKDADLIITTPMQHPVALEYKPDKMSAPRVIAKGRNWLGRKIKDLGREHDIPTVENVPLANALYRSVGVDQEIPAELYQPVAEALAGVYRGRRRSS